MDDQRAKVLGDGDRIHPLPEQVRGIQLDTDMGGLRALHELPDTGRVEDQVLRVQFQCHLDVEVGRLAVDLPPELLSDPPLIVENVQAPEFHAFTIQLGRRTVRLTGRQARHGDDTVLT